MSALVANHNSSKNQTNNNYLVKDQNMRYLDFEDFSHIGHGYETYTDGIQHPLELRKILTGDLAKEMSVTFRLSCEDTYKDLVHPCRDMSPDIVNDEDSCLEITESKSLADSINNFYASAALLPRPPKLIKAGLLNPSSVTQPSGILTSTPALFLGGLWDTDPLSMEPLHNHQQPDYEDIASIISNRRPGRPPANQGTFDPESGTIRYLCRLECGASLASAKGRRKHEKKHCPNMPKDHLMGGVGAPGLFAVNPLMGHSLFHGRIPMTQRERFECRICGKVLKTYEGRRLHEKLQHKPKTDDSDKDKKKDTESLESVELEDGEVVGHLIEDEDLLDEEDGEEGVEDIEDIGDDDDE
jgi:hypothetical protein